MTADSTDERASSARVVTKPASAPGKASESGVVVRPPQQAADRAVPAPVGTLRRRRNLLRLRHRGAAALAFADAASGAAVVAVMASAVGGSQADALLLGPVVGGALALNAQAGLYRPGLMAYALDELPAVASRVAVVWCVAAALLASLDRPSALDWAALLIAISANAVLTATARFLVHGFRRMKARRRPRPALIVGSGRLARTVAGVFSEHSCYGLRPVGFVDLVGTADTAAALDGASDATGTDAGDGHADRDGAPLPVVVVLEDVTRAVIQNTVRDVVFLGSPWEEARNALLARALGERGVTGWLVRPGCAVGAHGTHDGGPSHVWGFSCRRLSLECPGSGWSWRKRLLDLALVAPALVVAAPLLAACALAVRLSDGRGVIFRQERVGLGGGPFTLLKFRTLRPADENESATLWSVAGDERMSAVGRLLRRTSLDELPQLWNVLRGDMSLVGPRPERPYFVQQFSQELPGYAERHRSPVGITGLAQVHGLRGNTSIEDRARFDNHYIETWSLWQDVRIMFRTVTSFFRLEGR
ncbi:exopolysaccharide biosynthesis polyprenyl glycosylphosphotransferase [Streptomyces sp. HNM0575]|uniref:exopolysaccharide biosynthesis polyprenyl glycosylphosphotransferase n=1 Tax=Streptomyces sp. HNM0575 TaxID=2716338 RepID=UPI00145E4526|nr:exopolysaccharide biosynthesis polyprenyl glycosylphosphotransferase [Streptomyces sp. HNM0575]NLU72560.1 exopolysaccharide biosynthesis polyprenyl glycosylphosphotransferase [Streptomyces sp. HNM0575]